MNIDEVLASRISDVIKGMPALERPLRLDQIGRQGWNILRQDMRLPLAVLKSSALDHNSKWMRDFLKTKNVKIAPHGKTTMSPQLFARQLADGAWGITCANVAQLQVYRAFGVPRILFANQLVDREGIRYVFDEIERDPRFEFYALVDSLDGVSMLARESACRAVQQPLRLLIEVGLPAGRTGVRTLEEAVAIAHAVAGAPGLVLCGVGSFEGVFSGDGDLMLERQVNILFDLQAAVARNLRGLFLQDVPVILTAGGSQFPDIAATRLSEIDLGRPCEVIIRSGCYLTHDSAHYARAMVRMSQRAPDILTATGVLTPALELWAIVQSRPEKTLAFANFGKRDTGTDIGLPVPLFWYRPGLHATPASIPVGHSVTKLNDQHAYLEIPSDSPLRTGDLIAFGISHPCTTFDKWRVIPVVNDGYDVVDAIQTYF